MVRMGDEIEVPAGLVDDPRVRRQVWRGLGVRSPREIAEQTGLSPEEVLVVKEQMLAEVDVLTVQQTRAKLLSDLQDIARRAQADYDSVDDEFKSGILNSAIAAQKAVLVELNRSSKGEQDAVDSLNSLRVRELLNLMDVVVVRSVATIAGEHGLDEDALVEVFNENLVAAARDLEG